MRIKKYAAPSMKEALLQIKKDLGDDAMILKTRKLPKKLFSMGETNTIEVTAALEEIAPHQPSKNTAAIQETVGAQNSRLTKLYENASNKQTLNQQPPLKNYSLLPKVNSHNPRHSVTDETLNKPPLQSVEYLEIKEDINQLKEMISSALETHESGENQDVAMDEEWTLFYDRLIGTEIASEFAVDIIYQLRNEQIEYTGSIDKKIIQLMSKHFPVSGPLTQQKKEPLLVAFIGPTGAGKTTTIAKLAAYYSLNKKSSVSLITADTYRMAAIEQLKSFADIINIKLQILFSIEDSQNALLECKNDQLVLIDTAGRSQNNRNHMAELELLLRTLKPDITNLVLSATTKDSDLQDIIKRYDTLKFNRLLFTKLDETSKLGNVFNTVKRSGIAVSYLTTGQNVPDDIELAQPNRFVQRLMHGSVV